MIKKIALSLLLLAVPLQAMALQTNDLLSLVAMPLAVAAVSDLMGVPQNQLADLAATLNQANVAPVEFVQVMRFVPVALVTTVPPQQPQFVQFVQTQVAQGVTGPALITAIQQQLPVYGVPASQITVTAPAPVIIDQPNFFPPIVRTRFAEARGNPHGGPPGQLKKIEGLQTGAEVVHGMKPGRRFEPVAPAEVVEQQRPEHGNPHFGRGEGERGHGNPHGMPPGQAKKFENVPPMFSGAPAPAVHVPPGQEKKLGNQERKGGEGHGHEKD